MAEPDSDKNQTATVAEPDSDKPTKVFHDPVHGQIELHPLLVKIIDTPEFQRLRYIKQLGGASFVYPGACHTRFEHSIGVAYLAGELAEALRSRQPELKITDKDILCVKIAGLCHDLGHGPFSNLYGKMFIPKVPKDKGTWQREKATEKLFDHLMTENGLKKEMKNFDLEEKDLLFIKEMMNPGTVQDNVWSFKGRGEEMSFLYEIVTNKLNGIDVDKFDYLERDCLHVGLKNTFDYRRFFLFARVHEMNGRKHICLREKEVGNLYDMFYSRYSLHRRVYQHKVTQSVELMISDALLKAKWEYTFAGDIEDKNFPKEYTKLTDEIFEKILHSTEPELKDAREILENIHKRNLYKFVGEAKDHKGPIPGALGKGGADPVQSASVSEGQPIDRQTTSHSHTDAISLSSIAEDSKLQDELKNELKTAMEAVPGGKTTLEDFEVYSFVFYYGSQGQDPIDKTLFCLKTTPEILIIPREQRSHFIPEHFCERILRVYWKNTGNDETTLSMLKKAKTKFSNWFIEKGLIDSQLLGEDEEDVR